MLYYVPFRSHVDLHCGAKLVFRMLVVYDRVCACLDYVFGLRCRFISYDYFAKALRVQ